MNITYLFKSAYIYATQLMEPNSFKTFEFSRCWVDYRVFEIPDLEDASWPCVRFANVGMMVLMTILA